MVRIVVSETEVVQAIFNFMVNFKEINERAKKDGGNIYHPIAVEMCNIIGYWIEETQESARDYERILRSRTNYFITNRVAGTEDLRERITVREAKPYFYLSFTIKNKVYTSNFTLTFDKSKYFRRIKALNSKR